MGHILSEVSLTGLTVTAQRLPPNPTHLIKVSLAIPLQSPLLLPTIFNRYRQQYLTLRTEC